MTTEYWSEDYTPVTLDDSDTVTGAVDGRTWTNHGTGNILTAERLASVRVRLANAIQNGLAGYTETENVTVTPWPVAKPSPPHIYLEPDQPYYDPVTFGGGQEVWAYEVNMVVAYKHKASWDWFERVAPKIAAAVRGVTGARFEQMDKPSEAEVSDGRYLVATGHVTVKQPRT